MIEIRERLHAIRDRHDTWIIVLTVGTFACVIVGAICAVLLLTHQPTKPIAHYRPVLSTHSASVIVERMNASRAEADLAPLIIDTEFTAHAVDYNEWLVDTLPKRLREGGPAILPSSNSAPDLTTALFTHDPDRRWSRIGESVGRAESAVELHSALVNNPGHAAHIFDPTFTHIGIGVHVVDGTSYATARFASIS